MGDPLLPTLPKLPRSKIRHIRELLTKQVEKIIFTWHPLGFDPQLRKAIETIDEFFNPEHICEPPVRQ